MSLSRYLSLSLRAGDKLSLLPPVFVTVRVHVASLHIREPVSLTTVLEKTSSKNNIVRTSCYVWVSVSVMVMADPELNSMVTGREGPLNILPYALYSKDFSLEGELCAVVVDRGRVIS